MSRDSPVSESAYEDTWREINDVLDDVARLSQTELSNDQFFTEFISLAVRTLAARAGCVWLKGHDQSLSLRCHSNLANSGVPADPQSPAHQLHLNLLQRVLDDSTGTGVVLPPHVGSEQADSTLENPTPYLLLLSPIFVNGESLGIVEIFQRSDASIAASRGFLRFLDSTAQLAADFVRNSRLRDLKKQADVATRFELFTQEIHTSLNVRRTAMMLANEGRNVIGCDRVSVALSHGRRFRMLAVSGVDSINRRANLIRAAEELMQRTARTGHEFWYRDGQSDSQGKLPSQIEKPLNRFLDESPARELAVIPLRTRDLTHKDGKANGGAEKPVPKTRTIGVLFVERFEPFDDPTLPSRVDSVSRQGSLALGNATEHANLPFLPLIRILQGIGLRFTLRQLPRTIIVLTLLLGTLAAMILVPGEFTIDGRGELQPAERRGVFAKSTGVVEVLSKKLATDDPTPDVNKGDLLVQLDDSRIDFEFARVDGQLKTAQASLLTKQIQRRNLRPNDPNVRDMLDQLSAEETELEVEITGLQAQLAVLNRQTKDLKLTSPIKGSVITWDPNQVLDGRPVQQGERLLEVANVDGDWVLEIRVLDQNIGHVKTARRELKQDLHVSFVLATNPDVTLLGKVLSIAEETRHHEQDGATVLVTVAIDRGSIPAGQLRIGATVIPHIHCGQRAIGFVWFHEVIHAIKTRVLF